MGERTTALVLASASGDYEFALVEGKTYVLGRSPKDDLTVRDGTISRQHASLEVVDGGVIVTDLGSHNGCFLNGTRLAEETVQVGDRLLFGKVQFSLLVPEVAEEPSTAQRSAAGTGSQGLTVIREMDLALDDVEVAKLKLLLKLAHDLAEPLDSDEILARVCERTLRLTDVDRVAIVSVEGESMDLVTRIARGRDGLEPDFTIPRSMAFTSVSEMSPVRADLAALDSRIREESLLIRDIQTAMCVPLLDRTSRVIGLFYADSALPGRVFTDDDLDFLSSVAGLVASAVRNGELLTALRQKADALDSFRDRLAPNLGEEFLGGGTVVDEGERREVAVIEARLAGLAELTGTEEAARVSGILNTFFSAMSEIVIDYGGALDRLQESRVVATWGATYARKDNPDRALAAARDMLRSWASLRDDGRVPKQLGVAVGMGAGTAFVAVTRVDGTPWFTVSGPPALQATRLSLKARPEEILITEQARNSLAKRPAKEKRLLLHRPTAYRVLGYGGPGER